MKRKIKLTEEQETLVKNIKSDLRKASKNTTLDEAHIDADEALCKLLDGLGFEDVVKIWRKVGKWYS